MNASVCLLFIDLDGLKQVNYRLGHEMGARLIVDATQILKQTFRESDVIARLGGDEIAVFVPGCGMGSDVVTRLQESVVQFNQAIQCPYTLSMSISLAICQVNTITLLKQMMTQAAQLMYEQKRIKYLGFE